MHTALPIFVFLAACDAAIPSFGPPIDGSTPLDPAGLPTGNFIGTESNAGLGSALAASAHGIWAGAPHGVNGQIFALTTTGLDLVAEGSGKLGHALAPRGAGWIAGAALSENLQGQVLTDDGEVLHTGPQSAGLAVAGDAEDDTRWAAATGSGWVGSNGAGTTEHRPSALALSPGGLAVGMARGEKALATPTGAWPRPSEQDEAGFSLAAGDVDGDGDVEWVVGAPGHNRVHILSPSLDLEATIEGTNLDAKRFGAAIAIGDADGVEPLDLLVGAPMSGEGIEGAAFLFLGGSWEAPAISWSGDEEGEQLGFAVGLAPSRVVLGAPGASNNPGRVLVVAP